jgi:hypothetical protein
MKPLVAAVFASALLQTCTSLVPTYDPNAGARMALDQARAQLEARPGQTDPAVVFAAAVQSVAPRMSVEERDALVQEALLYLDAAADNEPERAWAARAAEGTMRQAVGDAAGAESALRLSLQLRPNLVALPPLTQLLVASGRAGEVPALCAAARPHHGTPDELHLLMSTCQRAGDPLAWASDADRVTWQQQELALQKAAIAAEAQRQAEQEALYASFSDPAPTSSGSSSTPTSSGPAMASVTLKNNCSDRVRVFFGDKPKYGSGRYSWISSNSVSSYSMQAGDMLWIVDESDNGLSSTSVGAGSSRVEITSQCTGFVIR